MAGDAVLSQQRGHRVDDVGERASAPGGTPPRTPRWPRCRPRARCRRAPPPRGPGVRRGTPRRRAGRTPTSAASSSPPAARVSGTRSGQARPSAIGISIVGGLACASVDPSVNSTIECTTLVGCTTTSIRSNGMSKSRCASITSRPLLTRVAELIVTTGPMSQVGWFSACSGVTSASSSRRAPAEGPPAGGQHQAAYLLGAAAAQALRQRTVLAVDRHDLTGLRQRGDDRAADDQRLLVGQGQRVARLQRSHRGPQPDRPGDPVEHHVAGQPRRLGRRRLTEPGVRRPELRDLLLEELLLRPARRQPHDPEPVGVGPHHVQRLGPDRPGRPQDDDIALLTHGPSVPAGRESRGRRCGWEPESPSALWGPPPAAAVTRRALSAKR